MNALRGGAVLLTTVLVGALVMVGAAPAQAASQYRWWSYWFGTPGASSWAYAPVGPSGHRVDDGSVEGWRFEVGVPNPSAAPPRSAAGSAFATICAGHDRPEGKDRVALVVDFGTSDDAPDGERPPSNTVQGTCVVVPDRSTGSAVLAAAGYAVRTDRSGLVCSLQGYPRSECGVVVTPHVGPTAKPSTGPTAKPSEKPATEPAARPSSSGGAGATTGPTDTPTRSTRPGTKTQTPSTLASDRPPPSSAAAAPATSDVPVALTVGPPPQGPGSGGAVGLLAGIAVVAGVAGAAFWRGRTARSAP